MSKRQSWCTSRSLPRGSTTAGQSATRSRCGELRARLGVVLTGRRLLAPLTLLAFAVIGVYAYRPNDVQGSFAVTAVLSAIFCAWLVTATERALAPSADAILTVAAGGPAPAWRGRLALVAMFTLGITVAFLVWPTT